MAAIKIFSGYGDNRYYINKNIKFLRKTFLSGVLCLFLLFNLGVFPYIRPPSEAFAQTISFPGIEKVVQPAFLDKFKLNQRAKKKIMVLLKGYKTYKGLSIAEDAVLMKKVQSTVRSRQDRVLNTLDPKQFQLKHRFDNILGFSGEATLPAIKALADMDEVELIEEDREVFMYTAEGIPLMGADGLHSLGYYGSGVSIAIVDTGVDYTHPELGGGGFPNSKVIGGYDIGDSDSDPLDCDGHGTSCAGVAAGNSGGGYAGGVAPSAKIYALKIVPGCEGFASSSDIVAAWDWCVNHKNDDPSNPILVISLSFGGGYANSSSCCDENSPTLATAAANAVANGITVFCASGNDGFCDGIGDPACLTDTISVGAVYDADLGQWRGCNYAAGLSCNISSDNCTCSGMPYIIDTSADVVTGYSNSASFLDILAPSDCAKTTAIVGGGDVDGNYYSCFNGTSAACPYAAGAGALLQSYAMSQTGAFLTPAQLKSALVNYGDPVTDSKNSLTHPRVNVLASTAAIDDTGTTTTAGPSTTTTAGPSTTTSVPSVFTISGSVTGAISSNVPIVLTGAVNQIINTEDTGFYQFTNLASGYYIITPTLEGYVFEPTSRDINLTSDLSGINFVSRRVLPCVAETVYQENSEQVEILRFFRDKVLAQIPEGQEIIRLYYQWSPAIARAMEDDEEFKEEAKEMIDGILPMVRELVE